MDNSGKERRFIAQRAVLRAVKLSVYARLVYFDLDDRTGYNQCCWPKQSTIATCLGFSLRMVNQGIGELVARGLIREERKSKGVEYFLSWNDPMVRAERVTPTRNTRITGVRSLYEPQKEQTTEKRCSICGGSGVADITGEGAIPCECPDGVSFGERMPKAG